MSTATSRIKDILPLTPLQEGMLFHCLYEPDGEHLYQTQVVLRIDGELDARRLREAAEACVRRHPNLQVSFQYRASGTPVQVVDREHPFDWTQADLRTQGPSELDEVLRRDWERGIDLRGGSLVRFTLARTAETVHHLAVTMHHTVIDGYSAVLLFDELFTAYTRFPVLGVLPAVRPYRQYLRWLAGQDRAEAARSWGAVLAGADDRIRFGGEADRGTGRTTLVESGFMLSDEMGAALRARARRCHVTLNTAVQAAWALTLGHMTGVDDVVFGATLSGRAGQIPGVDEMVGLLINTVPVRVRLLGDETVPSLLAQVQGQRARMQEHDHLGLTELQRAAGTTEPLFETTATLDERSVRGYRFEAPTHDLTVRQTGLTASSHHAISMVVTPGDRLEVALHFRGDLFGASERAAWVRTARRCFEIVAHEEEPLDRIEAVTGDDRAALLAAWTGPATDLPDDLRLHRLVEAQARRTPGACAVVFEDERLDYAQLDARADATAGGLLAAGLRPGDFCGILLDRGPDLVVSMLAVLKAGGAYVPLDPAFPADRVRGILRSTGATSLVTDRVRAPGLRAEGRTVVTPAAAHQRSRPVAVEVSAADPACVMFTSGSTGRPKGVVSSHAAVAGSIVGQAFARLAPGDVALQCSPVSWDACAFEIFAPLLTGATCLLQPGPKPEPEVIARLLERHPVSVLYLSASLLNYVLDERPELFRTVRTLLTGGEAASMPHIRRLLGGYPALRVLNVYSPLECMMVSVAHEAGTADAVRDSLPLGRPVGNKRMYVLDEQLRVVAPGAAGQLYLSGIGLAYGYLGQPAATAERFVACPFDAPGTRMYRTGDLARWTTDGVLEFLGRADQQVKLRGYRIEPAEVEKVVNGHPGVADTRVLVREDRPGDRRLVAYVSPAGGRRAENTDLADELHRYLSGLLPDYLMPAAFVPVRRFPYTANGKLDQAALPAPVYRADGDGGGPPRSDTERRLCEIFADVLGMPGFGVEDDFFRCGGHSLLAIRLLRRITDAFGTDVALSTLFRNPTVRRLAGHVDKAESTR